MIIYYFVKYFRQKNHASIGKLFRKTYLHHTVEVSAIVGMIDPAGSENEVIAATVLNASFTHQLAVTVIVNGVGGSEGS